MQEAVTIFTMQYTQIACPVVSAQIPPLPSSFTRKIIQKTLRVTAPAMAMHPHRPPQHNTIGLIPSSSIAIAVSIVVVVVVVVVVIM